MASVMFGTDIKDDHLHYDSLLQLILGIFFGCKI